MATEEKGIEKLYSIQELVQMGIGSRSKIDRLVKAGKLKKIKIGFSARFRESDIKSFIGGLEAI
ncbi:MULTISPECIES: helix-turn-helix transcriptional regulator [Pasteurellaceae]|uniref:Helix-turn-helix domain-containing protein n=1 Tax=Pasteurella atlantica TaxID=2827233 RepID=A0AAW8CPG1_9PAST|nr:helix-turn-helix domain-containing protein [Pasteurella atlantica]MBR0573860.1 helix-turn-helix domain-containing protein [Pasteurella atlantica]MDP8039252.1 helix-turn-helix domain-containing protein [Pasteurella atlantica]MDP8041343.1 helix-turn-helix domain-containing protein [Pasteurella atlantica]MDP8043479.1 helix-turn-helix domain-containing protein [Pasteurella atlantica]MDP8045602.1 helix-turn-helix domain-containing protein [Pasteurella atlantica]